MYLLLLAITLFYQLFESFHDIWIFPVCCDLRMVCGETTLFPNVDSFLLQGRYIFLKYILALGTDLQFGEEPGHEGTTEYLAKKRVLHFKWTRTHEGANGSSHNWCL